jgi:MlrC C-terminus
VLIGLCANPVFAAPGQKAAVEQDNESHDPLGRDTPRGTLIGFLSAAGKKEFALADPRDYRVIVVKSANHFRAWWTDVASLIIDCDPPGIGSNDLWSFAYKEKTQKLYPLDKDAVYK